MGERWMSEREKEFAESGATSWEELGKWKAQKDAAAAINKIPAEKWRIIQESVGVLGKLADAGGMREVLGSMSAGLTEQFKLQINALIAPLKNELYGALNQLLIAFGLDTLLQDLVNWASSVISESTNFWTAVIEGKLDEYMADYVERNRELVEAIEGYWAKHINAIVSVLADLGYWDEKWGIDIDELNRKGTAGGTMSGQFDNIDYDLINKTLAAKGFIVEKEQFRLKKGITRKRNVME